MRGESALMLTCSLLRSVDTLFLIYFNIHCCGLWESFMSVLSVCTLHTAWQLVPYITASQPHTHICAPHTSKKMHVHTHSHAEMQRHYYKWAQTNPDKSINIQTTNPLHAFFYPVGTFQSNYLILLKLYSIPLIAFCVDVNVLCKKMTTSDPTSLYTVCIYLLIYPSYKHLPPACPESCLYVLGGCCDNGWSNEMFDFLNTNSAAQHKLQ